MIVELLLTIMMMTTEGELEIIQDQPVKIEDAACPAADPENMRPYSECLLKICLEMGNRQAYEIMTADRVKYPDPSDYSLICRRPGVSIPADPSEFDGETTDD